MPHLKPVGHQSTNWMVRLVLMVATAAFTSFGTTSPPQHQLRASITRTQPSPLIERQWGYSTNYNLVRIPLHLQVSTYDATRVALQEMLTGSSPGMEDWAVGTIVGNYLGPLLTSIPLARLSSSRYIMQQAMYLPQFFSGPLGRVRLRRKSFLNFCCNGLYNNFHLGAMSWIAFDHHGCRLEDRHGDLSHGQLLMVGLLRRDDRSIGGQHEVDTGVWDEVGLELRDIHVQGSVEAKRCCQA